jgi:mitochondrial fission protein ELM1
MGIAQGGEMKRALVISDGKPGHFNQSFAFCRHLGLDYDILQVTFRSRLHKALSYVLDRLHIYTGALYSTDLKTAPSNWDIIVSTGSTTYYANKVMAKNTRLDNVAILYPKGFRLDFSHIFCPSYDHPPKQSNITELPLNLCAADPSFFEEKTAEFKSKHVPIKPAAGLIIGGPNAVSDMDPEALKQELDQIFSLTEGMERWVTTSRRTPAQVEEMLERYPFDYILINSKDPYNPVPAFIQLCDRLFVTSDSASMISECASFGSAKVDILMSRQLKTPNKFEELIRSLEALGAVHVFNGTLSAANTKIDLAERLKSGMGGD